MRAKGFSTDFRKIISGIATAAAVFVSVTALSLNSFAASSGKILKDGVRIRKEASTNSDIVTSLVKDDSITINGQTTGADGNIWYQITTANGENGYVRSDLANITDGSTPDTIGADGSVTAGDPSIRLVNPVSGTVTFDQNVRVRQDASTSSTITDSLETGTVVTIKGIKKGNDERDWYYITYNKDGNELVGFSRSDFITPDGELTDPVPDVPVEDTETTEEPAPEPEPEPVVQKDYETELQGEDWYLLDYPANVQYKISDIKALDKKLADKTKSVNGLRAALIIFIILAVAGLGGTAFFFLKLRDAKDQVAFSDAEKQRKARAARSESRPGVGPSRPSQGSARPAGPNGARPAQGGQRPMPGPNGQRPTGARPAGPNGARPAQGGQRPMPGPNGQRPAGARPAGPNGARPVQGGQRPMPGPNGQRPAGARPVQGARPIQTEGHPRPKTPDDDDFDYGFLNNNSGE